MVPDPSSTLDLTLATDHPAELEAPLRRPVSS
jgi:hypothetical protein